jgi:hypothetical protein
MACEGPQLLTGASTLLIVKRASGSRLGATHAYGYRMREAR